MTNALEPPLADAARCRGRKGGSFRLSSQSLFSGTGQIRHQVILITSYLVLWLALDYLSYQLEAVPGVSPWYLPHGLSLAFLTVFGPRYIPLLFVGPLINGSIFWLPEAPLALLLVCLSIVLGYGTGGAFLHVIRIDPGLRTTRDAFIFIATAFGSSLVVGFLAVAGIVFGGAIPSSQYLPVALTFWAGDTLGIFGIGPLFLMGCSWFKQRLNDDRDRLEVRRASRRQLPKEKLLVAQIALLVGTVALSSQTWGFLPAPPLYLLFIPVLWLSFSYGIVGAAFGIALSNLGPVGLLALASAEEPDLVNMQLSLAVVSIAGIIAGAAVTEARRRAEQLAESRAEIESARKNERTLYELRERVKELGCMYSIAKLTSDTSLPIADICHRAANILPGGWQYPEVTCAKIKIGQSEYMTSNFQRTPWMQESPIMGSGDAVGQIMVCYLEERPTEVEGPFLKEERQLIDAVATHIAQVVSQRDAAAKLAQAERLSAIGELTGGIAHDFNNLLTIILGNIDIVQELARHMGDAKLNQYVDNTIMGAESAARLTQQLLAFSRRQPLSPQTVQLNDLLQGMLSMLRRTLGEKVSVQHRFNEALPPVKIDPGQLESAVINLALNARDAMPNGGTITIETTSAPIEGGLDPMGEAIVPGNYVLLSVSDEGTGFAPQELAKMFEPFYTTKKAGKGSGLGLSMVYGFVRQSGGFVTVQSQPGKGATFTLHLPVSDAAETTVSDSTETATSLGDGETILVVEDQPQVREYLASVLAASGYRPFVAHDADSAFLLLRSIPSIDLLLTDIGLPGTNGVELAKAIISARPGSRVLYTSGYAYDALVSNGTLKEDVDLITKPFRKSELLNRVRQALGRTVVN